jgi:hypothetical protein
MLHTFHSASLVASARFSAACSGAKAHIFLALDGVAKATPLQSTIWAPAHPDFCFEVREKADAPLLHPSFRAGLRKALQHVS